MIDRRSSIDVNPGPKDIDGPRLRDDTLEEEKE